MSRPASGAKDAAVGSNRSGGRISGNLNRSEQNVSRGGDRSKQSQDGEHEWVLATCACVCHKLLGLRGNAPEILCMAQRSMQSTLKTLFLALLSVLATSVDGMMRMSCSAFMCCTSWNKMLMRHINVSLLNSSWETNFSVGLYATAFC
jgi:hypothetical protein